MIEPTQKDATPLAGGVDVGEINTSHNSMHELTVPEGILKAQWDQIARREGDRWAVRERNEIGEVIGTAFRDALGKKDFLPGGKRGLILRWPLANYAGSGPNDPVCVCEGASDTAALMGLGFEAVGVPMAGHCGKMLAEVLSDRHALIVADADDAGRSGAKKIADALLPRCLSVRIIEPPCGAKDAREAVIAGADCAAFLAIARATAPLKFTPAPSNGDLVMVRLSDVEPEELEWLWRGRIPVGKLTLIAGDPGLGKSFLTLDVAARVSRGAAWPDIPGVVTTPGGVVLLSAEDCVSDTIRPRLDAAGADVSRIVAVKAIHSLSANGRDSERSFDLARDLFALEKAIQSVPDCRLVVIDPVTAYLGGVDSHKNADIRALLAPLSQLATRLRVAVVAVTHLNKSVGGPAIYRAMGSLAFAATARVALLVSKDKDDPSRRLLLPIKNNIGPDTGGLAYRIEPVEVAGCPVVSWETALVNVSADDALASERGDGMERTERDDAADWLVDLLRLGPVLSKDVQREAKDAGHSWGTVRRAKAQLGIGSRKRSFDGPHEWYLPEDAHLPNVLSEDVHMASCEHLGAQSVEIDGSPPKMLTKEDLSTLGDREFLGNMPTDAPGV